MTPISPNYYTANSFTYIQYTPVAHTHPPKKLNHVIYHLYTSHPYPTNLIYKVSDHPPQNIFILITLTHTSIVIHHKSYHPPPPTIHIFPKLPNSLLFPPSYTFSTLHLPPQTPYIYYYIFLTSRPFWCVVYSQLPQNPVLRTPPLYNTVIHIMHVTYSVTIIHFPTYKKKICTQHTSYAHLLYTRTILYIVYITLNIFPLLFILPLFHPSPIPTLTTNLNFLTQVEQNFTLRTRAIFLSKHNFCVLRLAIENAIEAFSHLISHTQTQ